MAAKSHDPKRNAGFGRRVRQIFDEQIRLGQTPPSDGLDERLSAHSADVFQELEALREDVRPAPTWQEEIPARWWARLPAFSPMLLAVVAGLGLFWISTLTITRVEVRGASMAPAIFEADRLAVNRWAYRIEDLQRGDVVVLANAEDPTQPFIKRVVGLPGDTVEIIGGWLMVNDVAVDEPYLGTPDGFDFPETTLADGMLFVLGDNRRVSEDSRSWGPVPVTDVIGRVGFVYWPPQHIQWIEHYRSPLLAD
jgi:signal peptidase I